MGQQWRRHTAEFKAKVAVETLKEQQTLNELAILYRVHPVQVAQWKKQAVSGLPAVFSRGSSPSPAEVEAQQAPLYEEIGRLKVELEWLKRKAHWVS